MSPSLSIQTLLYHSANLIEGVLRDLERQSGIDQATAETWTHINEVINQEMIVVRRLLENSPFVCISRILVAAQLNMQTAAQIWETQEWSPLLELREATDGVAAHPWSRLHLGTNAGTSSTEAIERLGSSTVSVPKAMPGALKVEEGEIEMGNATATEKSKEKVAREGKGKGKAKAMEVGEAMEVERSEGKEKGKGKEVAEETVEKGMPKNKGKGRESHKGIRQARGRSRSAATSKYKLAERVATNSRDDGASIPPPGPSPMPSSGPPAATARRGRPSARRPPPKRLEPSRPSADDRRRVCR
ncbi:hypothetical protein PAXRUDRAFT_22527 [Paxillus rubicundulus Ve08.2h10]|uniref:Unplaced genomic scaffold scaffold_6540, whole genome shotgun sequence n=1 Tax=Paxillus rubicundulus Ve08.2h10 TaxID=930991 RepID=A0A0D0CN00_9AGAM|nr:hypothetical protein PAXRUDRAFT_22527 [Paxillus rubicundulus Ve08.2h10]